VTAATRSPRPSLPVPVLAAAVLLVLRGRALPSSPSSSSGRRPGSRSIWFCIDLTQPPVLLAGLRLHAPSVLLAGLTSIVQARPRPRPAREIGISRLESAASSPRGIRNRPRLPLPSGGRPRPASSGLGRLIPAMLVPPIVGSRPPRSPHQLFSVP
jgi:hypothetical protein